jgi:hypothetical protein
MKEKLWLTLITCLAYCVDKELWKAIDSLKEQVRVLREQQEKGRRILLNNRQRIKLAAKAKRLTRRLREENTVLFTPDAVLGWYHRLINPVMAEQLDAGTACHTSGSGARRCRELVSERLNPSKFHKRTA